MIITGDQLRYVTLRKMVGTQAHAASLLDVGIRTVQRRESGVTPITKEADLAIRMLGEDQLQRHLQRQSEAAQEERNGNDQAVEAAAQS